MLAAAVLCGTCPAAAADADAAYAARGNEPGWSLEIAPDRITLVMDYGAARITVPRPAEETVPGGRRYEAITEAHRLHVAIETRTCADTMTGIPYPDHVTVTVDGRELAGCGGDPEELLRGRPDRPRGRRFRGRRKHAAHAGLRGRRPAFRHDGLQRLWRGLCRQGRGVSIGPVASTRRACPPDLLRLEAAFLSILEAPARYELPDDGTLVIHGADGRTIVAARE